MRTVVLLLAGVAMVIATTRFAEAGGTHRRTRGISAPHFGVSLRLEARNITTHSGWRPSLVAFGTDSIGIRLAVTNLHTIASPRLYVGITDIIEGKPGFDEKGIGVRIGSLPDYRSLSVGPQMSVDKSIRAQDIGLGKLTVESRSIRLSRNGHQIRIGALVPTSSVLALATGGLIPVPPIPAHATVELLLQAEYPVPEMTQLGTGNTVHIENTRVRALRQPPANSARPGDVIRVGGRLDSGGYRPIEVNARFRVKAHDSGRWLSVALLVTSDSDIGEHEREIGHGILNSETGVPISLKVLPHSTEAESVKLGGCHGSPSTRLLDGITQRLIEVGDVGGYRRDDPCSGVEFDKWIVFSARVERAH